MAETKRAEVETLRRISLFHGVTDGDLENLATISQEVEYPPMTTIFSENDPATQVYVVVSGRVSLAICAPNAACRKMMEVRAGDLVGWSPLLERPRLSDTAVTMTPVKAVAFPGNTLLGFCRENPSFGFEFMLRVANVLAQRLNATRQQLFAMAGIQLPEVQVDTD